MFNLTGKKALITGSARGIGLAAAKALAAAGAEVILHGATESEHLKNTAARLGMKYVSGDLGSPDAVRKLADESGAVDVLILNGSVQSYTGISNFSDEEFQRMIRANVQSAFEFLHYFLPKMQEKKFGRIIAVSSVNQIRPASRLGVYSVTKAALANLIAMTAKEYAADGITANTILPGVIETDRNREVLKNKDFADGLLAKIPAQRFGKAEDCAGAIVFLASDEAAYVTGAEIPVAGGFQL